MLFVGGVSSFSISNAAAPASSMHGNHASFGPPTYCPYMIDSCNEDFFYGGQYRIRTRVAGLEGRHDIQTTLIALSLSRRYLFHEPNTWPLQYLFRFESPCTLRTPERSAYSPSFPSMSTISTNPLSFR